MSVEIAPAACSIPNALPNGNTPLHDAAANGDVDAIRALVARTLPPRTKTAARPFI